MDINATMRQLFDAQKTGAVGKAQELALAVLTWINRGGYAPHGFTIGQARRAAQMILCGVAMRACPVIGYVLEGEIAIPEPKK